MQLTAPLPAPVRRFLPVGGPRWAPVAAGLVGLVVVLGLGTVAYQRFFAPAPAAPLGQIVAVQRGTVASTVSSTGSVVAAKQAKLVFNTSGRIKDIGVAVGDQVKRGQIVASLVADSLQIKLDQARSQLAVAQVKLQQMTEGATPEEVAAAQASYDAAQAKLDLVKAGATTADLQAAQAAVAQARASYDQANAKYQAVQAGSTTGDVESARQALAAAQSKFYQLTLPTPDELADAQATVAKARGDLSVAQAQLQQAQVKNSIPTAVADAQAKWLTAARALHDAHKTFDESGSAYQQALAGLNAAQVAVDGSNAVTDSQCSNFGSSSSQCTSAKTSAANNQANLLAAQQKVADARSNGWDSISAQKAVDAAQASYDTARATLDQTRALAAIPADLISAQNTYDKAVTTLTTAEAALHKATSPRPEDIASVRAALDAAQAKFDAATAQADGDAASVQSGLDSAQAGLDSANAKMALLRAGPTEADVASARSSLAAAALSLAQKNGGAVKASDIALQQEAVRQAELAVQQAQLDLANSQLSAPFDGTVAAINGNVGEQAPTGTAGFMTLVDPSQVRVDVTVDETDVAKLVVGQRALVTFDAVPGRPYVGKVIAVSPTGTLSQGVVTYAVSLSIEPARFGANGNTQGLPLTQLLGGSGTVVQADGQAQDASGERASGQRVQSGQQGQGRQQPVEAAPVLPSGLTANATVITAQKDDVLYVPLRAVRRRGTNQVVEVLTADGKTETRVVRTGVSNDQSVEIVEGLNEGDRVVIPTTTTRAPNVGGPGGGIGGGGPVIRGG